MLTRDEEGNFYVFGPLAVLSATFLSISSSALWSRNVGETSCGWRISYSPDGRAFAIWVLIYLYTVASVAMQLTSLVAILGWWSNFLWVLAWVCCTLWVPLFDAEYPDALRAAAVVIVGAAACAVMAAWESQMWIADDWEQRGKQLAVGLPLTLLAGWLLTASSLGVGIAWLANQPGAYRTCVRVEPKRPGETEAEYRYRRRVLYREAYAKAPSEVSIVPFLLSFLIGGLAVAIPDPVLTLPLAWAIVNLEAFPSVVYVGSLMVLGCGAAGACLRLGFFPDS